MSVIEVFPGLRQATYRGHRLHGEQMAWTEKNCYSDFWIELLHVLELEPCALFPFTLALDFEGDQWTFFKPPLEELRDLYGIGVQELTVWRPLIEHAVEHLGSGKLIATEADSFWLPDTAGTDYRSHHAKTSILLARLDTDAGELGYFHNASYFELSGEDFVQLFRMAPLPGSTDLPFFAELVRIDRLEKRSEADLAARSLDLLRRHLARRPPTNPFACFGDRFAQDFPYLHAGGLPRYHAWAFASIRQAGAAFELAAANLRWLARLGSPGLATAADAFDTISQANKALILKGARAINSGRLVDAAPLVAEMAQAWDRGMDQLDRQLDRPRL
jgi:hypothetical protein